MNKLPRPDFFDDFDALHALSENKMLASYPHLAPYVGTIKAGYNQYIAVNGNACLVDEIDLPQQIEGYLKNHYKSPPQDLSHITEIRNRSGVAISVSCPRITVPLRLSITKQIKGRLDGPEAVFG